LIRFSNIIIVLCTTDYSNPLDLSFSHKKYSKIPEYAFNNKITSISSEIGKLVNLKELDASNNKITSISSEIGKLVNLKELDASNNKITSISSEIGKLVN